MVVVSVFYIGPMVMKIGLIQENKDKVDVGWVNDLATGIANFYWGRRHFHGWSLMARHHGPRDVPPMGG